MAERATGKAKRASQQQPAVPTRVAERQGADARTSLPLSPSDQLGAVVRERDALKAELEAARARIALLQQQRDQIVNRIDWIIDSLHSLLEDER